MDEVYKHVTDSRYCTSYKISNLGNVLKIKSGRILKPYIHYKQGYRIVELSVNGKSNKFTIHRLIAEAFIPNPDNKCCVNHKDGDRLNNELDNLEWVTNKENIRHGFIRRNGEIKSQSSSISLSKIKELRNKAVAEGLDLYTLIINHFEN